jgi:hypothetical protein
MSMHPFRNYFKEYKGNHNLFVETGSFTGEGIALARQAGFKEIKSMDISLANVEYCCERFKDKRNVTVVRGDSAKFLEVLLMDIKEPAMIWLDAHSQLFDDEPPAENPFPLIKELEQIKQHPIKTHTIIIDDILILTHPEITGWTKKDIEGRLLEINPNYKLVYLSNPVVNNILLAHV